MSVLSCRCVLGLMHWYGVMSVDAMMYWERLIRYLGATDTVDTTSIMVCASLTCIHQSFPCFDKQNIRYYMHHHLITHLHRTTTTTGSIPSHSKHCSHNEKHPPRKRQNRQRLQRNSPRVRFRIHFLHHLRSIRQMHARETKNHQRRRPPLGNEHTRL